MFNNITLVNSGKLTVATEGDIAPYCIKDPQGHLVGIEVSVMKEVAQLLGLIYTPVVTPWTEIVSGLDEGRFDVSTAPMDITPERTTQVDLSNGWAQSGAQLIALKDSSLTDEQLSSLGCGMLGNSSWEKLAHQNKFAVIKPMATNELAMEALMNKQIGFMITDLLSADYFINKLNLPFRKVGMPLNVCQKGWAVKKGNQALLDALNATLASIVANGTYERVTTSLIGLNPYPGEPRK